MSWSHNCKRVIRVLVSLLSLLLWLLLPWLLFSFVSVLQKSIFCFEGFTFDCVVAFATFILLFCSVCCLDSLLVGQCFYNTTARNSCCTASVMLQLLLHCERRDVFCLRSLVVERMKCTKRELISEYWRLLWSSDTSLDPVKHRRRTLDDCNQQLTEELSYCVLCWLVLFCATLPRLFISSRIKYSSTPVNRMQCLSCYLFRIIIFCKVNWFLCYNFVYRTTHCVVNWMFATVCTASC